MLPFEKIVPSSFQPRREFDRYELMELSQSIRENGLIQPLTVRKKDNLYELISGERRLRASVIAGLKEVPCILVSASDRECSLMCLIENIQRKDLNFFEEAEGILKLMHDFSLTGQEAASKLGMAQSTLSNKLRILKLKKSIRQRMIAARLSERHARALIRLPEEEREELLNKIIAEEMSVDETEKAVAAILAPKEEPKRQQRVFSVSDIRIFQNSLTRIIGTMRRSGVEASSKKSETEDFIEYTVIIPKHGRKPEMI